MATNTEQLFQSKHLAADIESIWDGAILSNREQGLTELEKAVARENIGAVPFGTMLKIMGHYNTIIDLQNGVKNPKVGDAYSVGTVVPFSLYIFDGLRNDWVDYGQIRATDVTARYVENQAVTNWTFDDSLFSDFQYKGRIAIDGITRSDFPIVAFQPKEASSGDFSAVCYCFDGYVEVWAKSIPTATVVCPVITYIVNGGNGKGITNASSGLVAGSITTDKLAPNAVSQVYNAVIPLADFSLVEEGWTRVNVNGLKESDTCVIDLASLTATQYAGNLSEITDSFGYIKQCENHDNTLEVWFAEDAPSTDIPIKILVIRR